MFALWNCKKNAYSNLVSKQKQTHRQRPNLCLPNGKGEGGINESLGLAYAKSLWMVTAAMKLKDTCSLEGKPIQHIKKQGHHFADKGPYHQSYDFSSNHIRMWVLDHKEGWVLKNWCFWTLLLEKTIPRTARSSKQSILNEINPEYSLEKWMLKFQYFGYLMWRTYSLEKERPWC